MAAIRVGATRSLSAPIKTATRSRPICRSRAVRSDQLHLILPGAYLGHPNPFRASGSAAGLYVQDGSGTPLPQLPSDFASVIPQSLENFREAFFLAEGTQDGALALSSKSTNGLAEYTFSGAFGGAIAGNIFAVRYGTQSMIRIELADPNGDGVPDSGVVAQEYSLGVGGPIDVLAPSTNDPFFGTLFVSGLVDKRVDQNPGAGRRFGQRQ